MPSADGEGELALCVILLASYPATPPCCAANANGGMEGGELCVAEPSISAACDAGAESLCMRGLAGAPSMLRWVW